jgi:protein-disulfide isomerase
MKARIGLSLAALTLVLASCGEGDGGNGSIAKPAEPVAAVPAPNGGDWTQIVSETPEGGFLMGNPNAPVKLMEYASYTCPHCAEFSEQAAQTLTSEYVKSGRVSWEFRPYVLFPTDPGITMLVRCQGPAAAFLLSEQLYAEQDQWTNRIRNMSDAEAEQMQSLPPEQRIVALVRATGLDQFFRQRGMPQGRIDSCLADSKGLERAMEISKIGTDKYKVQGTPTFFINGQLVADAATWERLRPQLNRALGQ